MNEALIRGSFKVVCPLLAILAVIFLLRGHDLPGGGFIGGLLMSLSFILHFIAYRESKTEFWINRNFTNIIAICLIILAFILITPMLLGKEGLSAIWTKIPFPIAGKISSVLVFDTVVFCIVSASTTMAYAKFISFSEGSLRRRKEQ